MTTVNTDDLRSRLVDQLVADGCVRSAPVEAAFRAVPRHLFVPGVDPAEAYADRSIQTKRAPDGRGISSASQPSIVAIMLEQLGLADAGGLALLVRSADAFAADEPWTTAPPFGLRVRSHGDGVLAGHLVELVRAWDAAGRPALSSLRVRAYPRDAVHTPRPDEVVLEKRHARLVCDWRPRG